MHRLSPTSVNRLLLAAFFAFLTVPLLAQTSVRTVKVLNGKDSVEIEVEASDRIVPQTQVLTGPDRLVVDFPNAVPSAQLHSQSVDRGEVKDVRVGLFQHKPPVTRIVLDLKTAQSYQVFPYGRTVMIKVMSDAKVIGGPQDNSAGVDNFPPEPATSPRLGRCQLHARSSNHQHRKYCQAHARSFFSQWAAWYSCQHGFALAGLARGAAAHRR